MNEHRTCVVVGVFKGQPTAVLNEAAVIAGHFAADLVCAFVDASRYSVDRLPDGTVVSMSLDPDMPESRHEKIDPALRSELAAVLDGGNIRWSARALAGGPAQELARLANELDAKMIVVGTRERGMRGTLREFVNGSVAVQLAHRQHRPVVVIPLNPVGDDGELPWKSTE